ncbi:glycosyltransferase family 2 protein [Pukyongiella litopenaei]|uniref:Glycosyltransferase family 2 protein n=1 Tax=Pukyongiella litopenaei TaxID=2605946 RepID=A0A2S0MV10_9RHOB|nr:glycosyltransferase family 2 protein [Pukyongiella litopenaei]AVO39726.1 glycosyltransferase family 2 protein [Pukyongiella litopenaei]
MGLWRTYRLRLKRKGLRLRAFRKRRELTAVTNRTAQIHGGDVLLFCTLRNERHRLGYFLKYYRGIGIDHFLIVDNGSTDGSGDYLSEQPDVSVWRSDASYKRARFGMDWLNWLLIRYGHRHWCLTVDPDEFLVFPFCDTRPLRALTDWMDASSVRSFPAMLLDMYPRGPLGAPAQSRAEGDDPFETNCWFDSGNYTLKKNPLFGNLWIQGGPRSRVFFADGPARAPALNKIPLVRWDRQFVYASSTHMLLPRGLNLVYDEWGGEKISGLLLHAKFTDAFAQKATEELARGEHYAASREYTAYARDARDGAELWCKWSERYQNWRQLESLGLMSRGNWA